jgi:hypothetical protein
VSHYWQRGICHETYPNWALQCPDSYHDAIHHCRLGAAARPWMRDAEESVVAGRVKATAQADKEDRSDRDIESETGRRWGEQRRFT